MSSSGKHNGSIIILKVLSGAQFGVEVALADGEYTLGSGQDDDLQFVDVFLKAGHARIRVDGRKVLVAGGAGAVVNQAGVVIDAGDDAWRELEPMEMVTIGAGTFAIGPADANWAGLSVTPKQNGMPPSGRGDKGRAGPLKNVWLKYGLAATGSLVVVLAATMFSFGFLAMGKTPVALAQTNSLNAVRAAFDQFDFGKSIDVRQEVDDAIYATGYVEEPVERRALHDAVTEAGVPVNLRLWVLSSIRAQLAGAIESFDVDVNFDLSQEGVATISGEILSDEVAERFLKYVQDEIGGISAIEFEVKTASSYFAEVKELAERSGINDTVLLRQLSGRIEASGVVVTDKLDAWVGFIQSYARHYADHIPLTSYVQLVNGQGQVVAQGSPTRIGPAALSKEDGMTDLDLAQLKQGSIGVSDIFLGLGDGSAPSPALDGGGRSDQGEPPAKSASPDVAQPAARPSDLDGPQPGTSPSVAQINLSDSARELLSNPATPPELLHPAAPDSLITDSQPTAELPNLDVQDGVVDQVLIQWDDKAARADQSADGPAQAGNVVRQRYLPLILYPASNSPPCWDGARVRVADIPVVLFWLDYLSLSKTLSLATFSQANQYLLLEAALSPTQTRQCAEIFAREQGVYFGEMSLYLDEVQRNPRFIRYLVRDFSSPQMDVAGVMHGERGRFIQMRDGTKVQESSSLTVDSKLMSVGDLGSLLQRDDAITPVIYSNSLTWKVTDL